MGHVLASVVARPSEHHQDAQRYKSVGVAQQGDGKEGHQKADNDRRLSPEAVGQKPGDMADDEGSEVENQQKPQPFAERETFIHHELRQPDSQAINHVEAHEVQQPHENGTEPATFSEQVDDWRFAGTLIDLKRRVCRQRL